jgi:hypothetical protein
MPFFFFLFFLFKDAFMLLMIFGDYLSFFFFTSFGPSGKKKVMLYVIRVKSSETSLSLSLPLCFFPKYRYLI